MGRNDPMQPEDYDKMTDEELIALANSNKKEVEDWDAENPDPQR